MFGYWLRTYLSNPNVSPDDFVDIVKRYYFTQFEWDPDRKHESIALENDNKRMRHSRVGDAVAISKNELSSKEMDGVHVEFTVEKSGTRFGGLNALMLGFVDSTAVDDVRLGTYLGQAERPKECVFYIFSSYFAAFSKV